MSLVPIAALGQHYDVSMRGMDAIIRLGCIIHRSDYWRRGHTLEKLGIDKLSVSELTPYVYGRRSLLGRVDNRATVKSRDAALGLVRHARIPAGGSAHINLNQSLFSLGAARETPAP
jgi:hypothetical protein